MNWFSSRVPASFSDIADELSSLRGQMALIQRKLAKRGRAGWSSAEEHGGELYDDLRDRLADALPLLRRRAHDAGRLARDNSGAILATVAVVGVLVAIAATQRGRKPARKSRRAAD